MEAFKDNKLVLTAAYEISGLPEEYQKQAAELLREHGELTLQDVKCLKGQYEAGQSRTQGKEQDGAEGQAGHREEAGTEGMARESGGGKEEYIDPQSDTVLSLCYSCMRYEACHEKKAAVTGCNAYINRTEANKTQEERYNEEQAALDRETARKLRERGQEGQAQQPAEKGQKERDIRISEGRHADIREGKLTFLLLKKDGFKVGEEITVREFKAGNPTGRGAALEIKYIWEDWTGLADDYCILGFEVRSVWGIDLGSSQA